MAKRIIKGKVSALWTIEFDDDSFATAEFFASLQRYFCKADNLEEYAQFLATNMARGLDYDWINGVGPVSRMRDEIEIYGENGPVGKAKYSDREWDYIVDEEEM